MTVVKKRTATRKEQQCGVCNRKITLTESYFDTDEKIGKKPWDTKKICTTCHPSGEVTEVKKAPKKTAAPKVEDTPPVAEEVKELPPKETEFTPPVNP